jgi:hypothetical protein
LNAAPVWSVYNQQPQPLGDRAASKARGDCSVLLSLQNLRSETQAHSRLAVLRLQGLAPSGKGTSWHRAAYPLSISLSIPSLPLFGGTAGFASKPACRMPAAPLSHSDLRPACGDTSVNAKQEGTP